MWQLLKAEIVYYKLSLFIVYSLCLLILLANMNFGIDGFYKLMGTSIIIAFISIGIMGAESDKEKRERFQASLPISIQQLSFVRLLFIVILQGGFFILWCIRYLIALNKIGMTDIYSMFCMNAFLFSVLNLFIIYSDLKFYNKFKYRAIFWCIIVSSISILFYYLFNGYVRSFFSIGPTFEKTLWDAVFTNFIAFLLFCVSHIVFVNRKSYLA